MTINTDYPKDGIMERGSILNRERWYSIRSGHSTIDIDCPRCRCGSWTNVSKGRLSHLVYKIWPWLWRRWVNRKNSHFNKWLKSNIGKKAFPNMKGK